MRKYVEKFQKKIYLDCRTSWLKIVVQVDNLLVGEHHGHFTSNKPPTQFQWKISRIEQVLVSDTFPNLWSLSVNGLQQIWCCLSNLNFWEWKTQRKIVFWPCFLKEITLFLIPKRGHAFMSFSLQKKPIMTFFHIYSFRWDSATAIYWYILWRATMELYCTFSRSTVKYQGWEEDTKRMLFLLSNEKQWFWEENNSSLGVG